MSKKTKLQWLCRDYLSRLKHVCETHGLGGWLDNIIKANMRGECEATEKEVELLSRAVNDERVTRKDIPIMLGKSYRQCMDDNDFDTIKKLPHVGIYSKVSVELYSNNK